MKITIEKYYPINQKGPLRAFVDLRIDQLVIRGCRVVHPENKSPFATMPQTESEKDGKKTYYPVVSLDKDIRDTVERVMVEHYLNGGASIQPPSHQQQSTQQPPQAQQQTQPQQQYSHQDEGLPF